jgi:hypothetical protein
MNFGFGTLTSGMVLLLNRQGAKSAKSNQLPSINSGTSKNCSFSRASKVFTYLTLALLASWRLFTPPEQQQAPPVSPAAGLPT